jgi:hypothetical protein
LVTFGIPLGYNNIVKDLLTSRMSGWFRACLFKANRKLDDFELAIP